MPTLTSHSPGTFCWIELGTTDAEAAKQFYTTLFRWTVNEIPMDDAGNLYYMFQKNGGDVGAMYKFMKGMEGMPPNWLSYVSVADADATAAQAKSLGATVHKEPFDVWDIGRMAVMADPQGAAFAIWQPKSHIGVGVRDEPGSLCWNELQFRDLDAAKKFYVPLFGWTLKESPEYTEMHVGGKAVGGMIASQAPAQAPSFWMPYFQVEDCDASAAQAQSLGAAVYAPPFDVPNVGRMAALADPQGAPFAIIQLEFNAGQ